MQRMHYALTLSILSMFLSTGALAASIQTRRSNVTDVPADVPVATQEATSSAIVDTLQTEELYLHVNKGPELEESLISLGWEASGDGTELTTEALAAERVIDSIESRMDDFVVESRIDDDGTESQAEDNDPIESRMDVDEAEEQPPAPVVITTPEPIAAPPVRLPEKPVHRPIASNALVPPPPPALPPIYTELKPFNPVPVTNNVWDVRVGTHTLTKHAPVNKPAPVINVPLETDRIDYDYSGEELPPSLPNLDIIPFVAADAVLGLSSNLDEEDERLIHKTMREDPAAKRPQHHQLNEKADTEEVLLAETNRRNLWLINGTSTAPGKFNQSSVSARNNSPPERLQTPVNRPPPSAKFPILPPRPIGTKKPDASPKPPPGFGGLRVESCNIYGQIYYVGKIIAELSSPCSECKCTEIGVSCFNLKC